MRAYDYSDSVEYYLVSEIADEATDPSKARTELNKLYKILMAGRRLRQRSNDVPTVTPQFGLLDAALEFSLHPLRIEPFKDDGFLNLRKAYWFVALHVPVLGEARFARQLVRLISIDKPTRTVFEIFASGPTLADIYSIVEAVEQESGREFVRKNFGRRREFSAFANSPLLSGYKARHQKETGKRVQISMCEEEAYVNCCNLLEAWVAERIQLNAMRVAA